VDAEHDGEEEKENRIDEKHGQEGYASRRSLALPIRAEMNTCAAASCMPSARMGLFVFQKNLRKRPRKFKRAGRVEVTKIDALRWVKQSWKPTDLAKIEDREVGFVRNESPPRR
jgi:hypothetical protein